MSSYARGFLSGLLFGFVALTLVAMAVDWAYPPIHLPLKFDNVIRIDLSK